MKTSQTRLNDERRQHAQASVEKRFGALFERLPMLCGFAVRHDLELTEVSVFAWPGYTAGRELYEDLAHAIADFAEQRPEAIELLRGRTFARAIH